MTSKAVTVCSCGAIDSIEVEVYAYAKLDAAKTTMGDGTTTDQVDVDWTDMTDLCVQPEDCGRDFRCRECGQGGKGPSYNEEPEFTIEVRDA